jgi:hypothetical protein
MALVCDDLADYGVALIQPPAAEYSELLADIETRLQNRPPGAPPLADNVPAISASAILVNRSPVAIASVAYIWTFRRENGRTSTHSFSPGTNPSVLLPFGLDERFRAIYAFWHVIFPGSKRLMTSSGFLIGDNTDVRPPVGDELWHGGSFSFGGGSSGRDEVLEPLKLTLDGVFFVDGGFAGPNRLGSWERTTFAAEACLECAVLAREARSKGTPSDEFFLQVQTHTGQTDELRLTPPPPSLDSEPDPERIRNFERQMVGRQVLSMLKHLDGQAIMARVEAWADAPAPKFHRLLSRGPGQTPSC